MFSREQLVAAIAVGNRYWQALADDDNRALLELLTGDTLEALALPDLAPGTPIPERDPLVTPGPGMAARIREYIGYDADDCRRMGLATSATMLTVDTVMFMYTPTDTGYRIEAGTLIAGRFVEFTLDEGRWLVAPIRRHRPAIDDIDLAPLFEAL